MTSKVISNGIKARKSSKFTEQYDYKLFFHLNGTCTQMIELKEKRVENMMHNGIYLINLFSVFTSHMIKTKNRNRSQNKVKNPGYVR